MIKGVFEELLWDWNWETHTEASGVCCLFQMEPNKTRRSPVSTYPHPQQQEANLLHQGVLPYLLLTLLLRGKGVVAALADLHVHDTGLLEAACDILQLQIQLCGSEPLPSLRHKSIKSSSLNLLVIVTVHHNTRLSHEHLQTFSFRWTGFRSCWFPEIYITQQSLFNLHRTGKQLQWAACKVLVTEIQ